MSAVSHAAAPEWNRTTVAMTSVAQRNAGLATGLVSIGSHQQVATFSIPAVRFVNDGCSEGGLNEYRRSYPRQRHC
jgi:hypothetical protein